MTTTKSSSSTGRLRKNYLATLRRQLPFAIVSTLLAFAFLVLPYLIDAPDHTKVYSVAGWSAESIRAYYTGQLQHGVYVNNTLSGVVAVWLALMGFAGALVSARYLHSKKMTDLFHSLPLTRSQLLETNLAATLTAILGPFGVLYLGTAAGQLLAWGRYGAFGLYYLQILLFDLLFTVLYVAVVYLLTTLVAVNVGTTLDALMITGALGFLPSLVYVISGFLWSMEYYGASFHGELFLALNPFLFFMTKFRYSQERYVNVYPEAGAGSAYSYWEVSVEYGKLVPILLAWLAVAVLLLAGAWYCYRLRRSEIAGQTQPRGVLQTLTKCFACFLGGVVGLLGFYDHGMPAKLVAILIGGVCIGLVAELLLSRTVKFLRRNLLWLAATGAVCCVAFLLLHLDLFGYIRRVPAVEQVASVELRYSGRGGSIVEKLSHSPYGYYYVDYESSTVTLTDPEAIGIVVEAHQKTVQHRQTGNTYYDYNDEVYADFLVTYRLQGGGTIQRRYYHVDRDAYLDLTALEVNSEFLTQTYPLYVLDHYLLDGQVEYIRSASYVDPLGGTQPLRLDSDGLDALIEAMKADALDQPLESMTQPTNTTAGFVNLRYSIERMDDPELWILDDEIWVELGDWSTRTLPLLEQYGIDTGPADPDGVEAVYLTYRSYGYDTNGYRVSTMTPDVGEGFAYSLRGFLEGEENHYRYLEVEPSHIPAVRQAAFNTAVLYADSSTQLLAVVYDRGGQYVSQLVRLQDLPQALQAQAEELFRFSNEDGEPYYEDYWYTNEYGYQVVEAHPY